MTKQRAVLFDVDGVLIDSYESHYKSWRILTDELGLAFTESQFVSTFGRTTREIITERWPEVAPTDAAVAELDDRKEAIFRDIVTAEFPAMAGAVELIEALHTAGFALGVGSSGPRANVELSIDGLGCRHRLPVSISAAEVTRGKPDPEVFLLGAEQLGVDPGRCAVIEDAGPGIAAANAAGMISIALHSAGHQREEYRDANHIVDSLAELTPERIASWIG